jgi:hypothetical protein
MSKVPTSVPQVLTSAERWSCGEQRGREDDARFVWRVDRMLWLAAGLAAVLLLARLL